MARVFLNLKVALLRNRAAALRHDPRRARGLVVTAAVFAWLGYLELPGTIDQLATTGELPDPVEFLSMQSFSIVFLWIAMPLTFGGRRDLDVRRLQLLPLRPGAIARGLAATFVLSPWLWLTAAVAALVIASFPDARAHLPLMALGAAALVAMCALAGQVVATGADLLARQRRARDLLLLLSAGVSLVPVLLFVEIARQFEDPESASGVASVVGALPPAWPGRAIAAAGEGDIGLTLAAAAGSFAVVALCWWAWTGIISRAMLAEDSSTERAASRRDPYAGFARRLPHDRRGAVAALELRLLWREPARLPGVVLMTLFLGGMLTLIAAAGYGADDASMAVLGAGAVTVTTMSRRLNEVGDHATELWTNVVAGGDAGDDLVGRDLAGALIDLPLLALAGAVIATVTDGWAELGPGLALGVATLLAAYGGVHVVSVRMAQGTPRSKDSDRAQRQQDPVLALIGIVTWAVLAAPVFALAALPAALGAAWLGLAVPAALAYGAAVWGITRRWTGSWLDRHQADLLVQIQS